MSLSEFVLLGIESQSWIVHFSYLTRSTQASSKGSVGMGALLIPHKFKEQ